MFRMALVPTQPPVRCLPEDFFSGSNIATVKLITHLLMVQTHGSFSSVPLYAFMTSCIGTGNFTYTLLMQKATSPKWVDKVNKLNS